MSARELGKQVVAQVWGILKTEGFTRKGAIFFRDSTELGERYAIVGNRWNSGSEPYEFSVSVGAFFPDFPARTDAKGFWKYCHAVGGTDAVAPGSPVFFRVTAENVNQVSTEVLEIIRRASMVLPSVALRARERVKLGFISPLPVPDTWP